MCFSGEMSATFAGLGLFLAWWVHSRTENTELAVGVFFFFTMELLQAIQYYFIADSLVSPECETLINKALTIVGYIHICLQPYFCHVINAALTKSEMYLQQYRVVKKLCLIGGALLFLRFLLAPVATTMDVSNSTEWLRGEKLCTYKGRYHLAWVRRFLLFCLFSLVI